MTSFLGSFSESTQAKTKHLQMVCKDAVSAFKPQKNWGSVRGPTGRIQHITKQAINDMPGGYNRFPTRNKLSEKTTTCIWFRFRGKV